MDLTIFWTIFGPFFWTILSGGKHTISTQGGTGCSLLVYWGRAGRHSVIPQRRSMTTQGEVGGGCNSKRCWLTELLLDLTNYFTESVFRLTFLMPKFLRWAAAFFIFFFFVMRMQNCHLNTGLKLLLKISRLWFSTAKLCAWLLSRLMHHQLLHVYLCVYSI